jgi:uncharacterized protein YbaA (DUF1428 family)
MSYVDGFLLPVPKKNLKDYIAISKRAAKIWRKHGAIEYRECVLDDPKAKGCLPFPKGAKTKSGETVVFSWIVYKSKANRAAVLKKAMKDPALLAMMEAGQCPFDPSRMMYGGFKVIVDA